eukprot:384490-Prymnesium_polylepis.1
MSSRDCRCDPPNFSQLNQNVSASFSISFRYTCRHVRGDAMSAIAASELCPLEGHVHVRVFRGCEDCPSRSPFHECRDMLIAADKSLSPIKEEARIHSRILYVWESIPCSGSLGDCSS